MLKLLSFLDDPFQLRREYHLMVDVEITKEQVGDSKQITITENTCYVDVETRTYYEYFAIKCDENQITPHSVHISDIDKISADFGENKIYVKKDNLDTSFSNLYKIKGVYDKKTLKEISVKRAEPMEIFTCAIKENFGDNCSKLFTLVISSLLCNSSY